jgi:hypothetical protein
MGIEKEYLDTRFWLAYKELNFMKIDYNRVQLVQ